MLRINSITNPRLLRRRVIWENLRNGIHWNRFSNALTRKYLVFCPFSNESSLLDWFHNNVLLECHSTPVLQNPQTLIEFMPFRAGIWFFVIGNLRMKRIQIKQTLCNKMCLWSTIYTFRAVFIFVSVAHSPKKQNFAVEKFPNTKLITFGTFYIRGHLAKGRFQEEMKFQTIS